jgi:hypothetical protein
MSEKDIEVVFVGDAYVQRPDPDSAFMWAIICVRRISRSVVWRPLLPTRSIWCRMAASLILGRPNDAQHLLFPETVLPQGDALFRSFCFLVAHLFEIRDISLGKGLYFLVRIGQPVEHLLPFAFIGLDHPEFS